MRLPEFQADHRDIMADLEAAGEHWLELRAAGKDTHKAEATLRELDRASRRLERKINTAEKRLRERKH